MSESSRDAMTILCAWMMDAFRQPTRRSMAPARPLERAAAPLPDGGFARSEEEDGKLPEPRLTSLAFGEVVHEPPAQRARDTYPNRSTPSTAADP